MIGEQLVKWRLKKFIQQQHSALSTVVNLGRLSMYLTSALQVQT